jgi:tetratricopeptide (TPR) repeat protein
LHQREGRHLEALALFERAGTIKGRFAEGFYYLAKAQLDADRPDAALASARKGLEIDPRSTVAAMGYFVMADVFARRGRMTEAEQAFARGRAIETHRGER